MTRQTTLFFILILLVIFPACSSKHKLKFETINVCVTPDNQTKTDLDQIRIDLEKEAINEFMIKYKDYSASNVVFLDRFYYNIQEMEKFCLKAKMTINLEDKKKKKEKIKIKDFCYKAGNTRISDIVTQAVDAGLKETIYSKYPKLKTGDWNLVKKSIFKIKHSKPDIDLEKNRVCLDIKAEFYTDDMEMLTINKNFKKDKIILKENFAKFKPGDSPQIYGKNLVIQQEDQRKGLTTLEEDDIKAVFFAGKKEKTEITIYIHHKGDDQFFSDDYFFNLLNLIYSNKRNDSLKLKLKKDEFNNIKADFHLGRQKSQNIDVSFEEDLNVFKIVKTKREVMVFLNDKLAGAFFATGDVLNRVEVPLNHKTVLYEIEIKQKE